MRGRLVAAVSHACPLGRPPSEGASPLARWGSLPLGRSAVLQSRVHRFSRFVRFY